MKNDKLVILTAVLLVFLFTVISVTQVSAQTLPQENYIFLQKYSVISGTSDQGFGYIDFPTYYFNTTEESLESMVPINLTDQTQIIYGSGVGFSGDVGSGISTQLACYESLNVEDLIIASTNGTIQFNYDGTWITLSPGQVFEETVETDAYFGLTGDLIVNHEIRNFGIWDKADITAPDLTPMPSEDPTPSPDTTPTPFLLGDVTDDGSVDIVDALLVAQFYVGLEPSGFNQSAADVNCDGVVDIIDALLIARYYVGLVQDFCI